jgi:hypothetical protein
MGRSIGWVLAGAVAVGLGLAAVVVWVRMAQLAQVCASWVGPLVARCGVVAPVRDGLAVGAVAGLAGGALMLRAGMRWALR